MSPGTIRHNAPHPALWPALGIALLVVVNVAFDAVGGRGFIAQGTFLHIELRNGFPAGALIDVLNYGAAIAILAIGMTPVIATRGVDLSVGSIMAIAGAVAATMSVAGWSSAASIGAALSAAGVCGLANGLLVAGVGLQPFVATLVLMVAGRGVAQMITGGNVATFHDAVIEYIGLGRPAWLPLPFPFILASLLLVAALLGTRRTALGLLLEAVGGNPEASRLAGVRSRVLIGGAYVFSGLCAGVAGLIAAANIKGADSFNSGRNMELAAIFAVVVGGTPLTGGRFSLGGAFVGGLLMQCLTTTMYSRSIGADIAPLPQALVILAVCIAGSPRARAMVLGRRAAA